MMMTQLRSTQRGAGGKMARQSSMLLLLVVALIMIAAANAGGRSRIMASKTTKTTKPTGDVVCICHFPPSLCLIQLT